MPNLDLDLARRITEQIAALLARWAPEAQPWPEDRPAREFAALLRRRDTREVLYLPDLEAEPRWPPAIWAEDDSNRERVFIRVAADREEVRFASAVFNESLVHWEAAAATVTGAMNFQQMDPDRHWAMKLETAESLLREMGLTLIPPAAMRLRFGRWSLSELLDPRTDNVREAGQEVARLAERLSKAKGVRSPAQAYKRVLVILKLGYDLGTLADALEGREPSSLAELATWLAERPPPFAWTRPEEESVS